MPMNDNTVFNEVVKLTEDAMNILSQEDPYTKVHQIRAGLERLNEDGTVSTHLMTSGEYDGEYYAHPTLFPTGTNEDGSVAWSELEGDNAFNQALEDDEIFYFETDKEAKAFARGSWKK